RLMGARSVFVRFTGCNSEGDAVAGTLVLNASYEPLCVVPMRRAVVLVLAEKAFVVEAGEGCLHSATDSVPIPQVVRLASYVRVPYRRQVPLTRRAVLARDAHR